MDSLLSILQPPAQLGEIHARMATVLECQRYELLSADDPVLPEPGEPPLPRMRASEVGRRRARKVRADPNASGKTHRAQMLLALSDTPQTYRELAVATGLPVHVVRNTLGNLGTLGLVANLATSGAHGKYVLPPVERPKVKREVFDV